MAEIIKMFTTDHCIECPHCHSQTFYVVLCDDHESVDRLECGGFDLQGEPCEYQIPFDSDDEIVLELEGD